MPPSSPTAMLQQALALLPKRLVDAWASGQDVERSDINLACQNALLQGAEINQRFQCPSLHPLYDKTQAQLVTPLDVCAKLGDASLVQMMLDQGAEVEQQTFSCWADGLACHHLFNPSRMREMYDVLDLLTPFVKRKPSWMNWEYDPLTRLLLLQHKDQREGIVKLIQAGAEFESIQDFLVCHMHVARVYFECVQECNILKQRHDLTQHVDGANALNNSRRVL